MQNLEAMTWIFFFTQSILKKFFSVSLNEVNDDLKVKLLKSVNQLKKSF